jgi:hypothetical protein
LNYTITDLFIKELEYNTSILLDYNNYTFTSDYFNYEKSNNILEVLRIIFKKNNTGVSHDLLNFFEFLESSIDSSNNINYIFNSDNINEIGITKLILLSIYSIIKNVKYNFNIGNIEYSNDFTELEDLDRANIFKTFKKYY